MHFISSVMGGALLLVPASSSSPDVASINPIGAALDLLGLLASQHRQGLDESISTAGDSSLMLLCGVVLVALQLRRRQKTLRTSRFSL